MNKVLLSSMLSIGFLVASTADSSIPPMKARMTQAELQKKVAAAKEAEKQKIYETRQRRDSVMALKGLHDNLKSGKTTEHITQDGEATKLIREALQARIRILKALVQDKTMSRFVDKLKNNDFATDYKILNEAYNFAIVYLISQFGRHPKSSSNHTLNYINNVINQNYNNGFTTSQIADLTEDIEKLNSEIMDIAATKHGIDLSDVYQAAGGQFADEPVEAPAAATGSSATSSAAPEA